jgi:hypothetical protein
MSNYITAAGRVPMSAGALSFSPDGVLFVGDNKLASIFSYPTEFGAAPHSVGPFLIEDIDVRAALALIGTAARLVPAGMVVHPVTREVYISFAVPKEGRLEAAVVRVGLDGTITPFDLAAKDATVHYLSDIPDESETFKSRVGDWPVPSQEAYEKKARTPLRSMAIVDMKFHGGELFVSGVSNLEFSSTLRRIPFPFDGSSADTQLQIYHVAHGIYETRAPIRAMQFAHIEGEDTLIAAYACSPVVLIPVSQLAAGAKVTGKTIGDMGNGQPISMVSYRFEDRDLLFITNAARGPMVMEVSGFSNAKGFTPENAPAPFMLDLSPHMPAGPVGKQVMFVGSSLRADLISDEYFVSLTREADSGGLTLETLPVGPLPIRLEKIWVEYDFPGATFNLKESV